MEKNNSNLSSLIELYALGELEKDKIPVVEEQLRLNPSLKQEIEEIRNILGAVRESGLNEPSRRLTAETRNKVHRIMEREKRKPIIFVIRNFIRLAGRPAFASVAVLITITVSLFLIFFPNKTDKNGITTNTDKTNTRGYAITSEKTFYEYISNSADIFQIIVNMTNENTKSPVDLTQIVNEIGQGMILLENEDISNDYDRFLLISDIKSVWTALKEYAEGKSGTTYEKIKSEIIEKNILNRINQYSDK